MKKTQMWKIKFFNLLLQKKVYLKIRKANQLFTIEKEKKRRGNFSENIILFGKKSPRGIVPFPNIEMDTN